MTSPAKIAANRRNARRSTGPRSAAGKARARRNAFRHGLSTPASVDHVAMNWIDDLVLALTRDYSRQLEFELATVRGSSLGPNFSSICEWQPGGSRVGVNVSTVHDRGFLELDFQVDGKPIVQRFELTGILMQVGGVRWTVKCPESAKMVRDLYLLFRPGHTHFRSRHALALSYYSNWRKKRHGERANRLMDRLGATEWHESTDTSEKHAAPDI